MGINYKKLISDICAKTLSDQEISELNWRWESLAGVVNRSQYLKANTTQGLEDFLLFLHKKSNLVENSTRIDGVNYPYAHALVKVFERNGQWRKTYSEWKPKSHNARKQFSSLLLHLFGKYKLPAFMDNVWFKTDTGSYRYREWYINLSRGESLRVQKSKVLVTKKIARYFGTAPSDYSVEAALWWGIVFSEGGNERLATEFNAARPSQLSDRQIFWTGYIKFLIANPMIDNSQIGPIVDYINYQKIDHHDAYENGTIVSNPPPQPNFSLNNRNPNTLLRAVREWHTATSKMDYNDIIVFDKSPLKPYRRKKKDEENTVTYTIEQLTNNAQLYMEGDDLGHCVGSYVASCANNDCTIWSFSVLEKNSKSRLITIEVARNMIVQARGKFNRYPSLDEMAMINKWASQEKLSVASWVVSELD